jgi:hypothetical protein
MPLTFPASPSDGQIYSAANSRWVWSASDGAWNQQREDWFGYIPTGLGADRLAEDITGDKLNLSSTDTHLASDNVNFISDGEETIMTLSSVPTGLKLIIANISVLGEDNSEAVYRLKVGGTQVSLRYYKSPSASANYQRQNVYFAYTTTSSSNITVTQDCTLGGFGVTAKSGSTYTYLQYVRLMD